MRAGIALRIGLVLAITGILASVLTGLYAFNASRTLLVQSAEKQVLTSTRVIARRITVMMDNSARDARLLARLSPEALAGNNPSSPSAAQLAGTFSEMMAVHPEYFQIRLISADGYGKELVRVDREGTKALHIPAALLQEKGHFPYVFNTLLLPPNEVYISQAVINHERGAHDGEGRPSIQVATPVTTGNGRVAGLIVINVDLNGMFKLLAADLPGSFRLYLSNHHGDFLVHPDATQAFAFDAGRRALVQDQFPDSAALLNSTKENVVTKGPINTAPDHKLIAAFIKHTFTEHRQDAYFILGLSQPLSDVLKDTSLLGNVMIKIVLGLSLLATIIAVLLSRALIEPLEQIVRAVKSFGSQHSREPLPVKRRDEIGVLARAFAHMQQQIEEQIRTLHSNQQELRHLASHDNLTGLPNRRNFHDQLEHSLARCRRTGESLALLFMDLDHFKDINDTLGHAAGDEVLKTVARRIREAVREMDTVARLGGDEFIILLEGADARQASAVAEKLLQALQPGIAWHDKTLPVGASIGISIYPDQGHSATELLACADKAMYRAKQGGRQQFFMGDERPAP